MNNLDRDVGRLRACGTIPRGKSRLARRGGCTSKDTHPPPPQEGKQLARGSGLPRLASGSNRWGVAAPLPGVMLHIAGSWEDVQNFEDTYQGALEL